MSRIEALLAHKVTVPQPHVYGVCRADFRVCGGWGVLGAADSGIPSVEPVLLIQFRWDEALTFGIGHSGIGHIKVRIDSEDALAQAFGIGVVEHPSLRLRATSVVRQGADIAAVLYDECLYPHVLARLIAEMAEEIPSHDDSLESVTMLRSGIMRRVGSVDVDGLGRIFSDEDSMLPACARGFVGPWRPFAPLVKIAPPDERPSDFERAASRLRLNLWIDAKTALRDRLPRLSGVTTGRIDSHVVGPNAMGWVSLCPIPRSAIRDDGRHVVVDTYGMADDTVFITRFMLDRPSVSTPSLAHLVRAEIATVSFRVANQPFFLPAPMFRPNNNEHASVLYIAGPPTNGVRQVVPRGLRFVGHSHCAFDDPSQHVQRVLNATPNLTATPVSSTVHDQVVHYRTKFTRPGVTFFKTCVQDLPKDRACPTSTWVPWTAELRAPPSRRRHG